ncbi:MAG: cytochrome c-type biogenesis protein CcmF [Litorivivens sp.]
MFFSLAVDWWSKVANKRDKFASLFRQTPSYYGMMLGHLGIAVCLVGVAVTIYFSEEKDVRLEAGQSVTLSGYEFTLIKMNQVQGPNYVADQGEVRVRRAGETIVTLFPERRLYKASGSVMTEADIDAGVFRDLFVALGEPVDSDAWAVRVHYKPFVRWIWFGGMFIAIGGFVTILDRRYRAVRQRRALPALGAAA